MKKLLIWIGGALVVLILFFWLSDLGLYLGSETYAQAGTLHGEPVEAQALTCRYFTLGGIEERRGGWVAGTDPDTLLPDGTKPYVADDGCAVYYPWQVFGSEPLR